MLARILHTAIILGAHKKTAIRGVFSSRIKVKGGVMLFYLGTTWYIRLKPQKSLVRILTRT